MEENMKEEILESILKRPGNWNTEMLIEMVNDSMQDFRNMIHYGDEEELPKGAVPAIKELALIRYNRDGTEGIQSESQSSGGSTTYLNMLPDSVKRAVRKYRRLPR